MSARRKYGYQTFLEFHLCPGFIYRYQSVKPHVKTVIQVIGGLFLLFLYPLCNAGEQTLVIQTAVSGSMEFQVEIAETPEQRRQGLMHRRYLPAMSGMLFDYKSPKNVSFWMENTRIPLDILFIDQHGRIIKIHRNAVPQSRDYINSDGKVLAVLEVNAGVTDQYSIKTGDRVRHEIFEQ